MKMNQDEENQQCTNIRDICGTATSFKLEIGFTWLNRNFQAIIHPLNAVGLPKIIVQRCSGPATFALSTTANEAPFSTFVGLSDDVTVFSPNKQAPIGKIVRRKAAIVPDDEADIFCFTTKTKFTLKNVKDNNSPASMKIFDSNGIILGTASVNKWKKSGFCSTTSIQQLLFHISDGMAEPVKTMLIVAFTNWARWSKLEINGRDTSFLIKLTVALMLTFLGLAILAFSIGKHSDAVKLQKY